MKNIEVLFSRHRLESYESIEAHFANFALIGKIAPMLLMIEVCLRNCIDKRLGGEESNWLYNAKESFIQNAIKKENQFKQKRLSHNQLISKFSFGFWIEVLDKIHNIGVFIDSNAMCLQRYCPSNSEIVNNHTISNYTKMKVIFSFFFNRRNRAFHAENLNKLDDYGNSVIRAKFGKNIFRIDFLCIETFLSDVLNSFGANEFIVEV